MGRIMRNGLHYEEWVTRECTAFNAWLPSLIACLLALPS